MMFFVTEKRLQAILEADRSQQRIVATRERLEAENRERLQRLRDTIIQDAKRTRVLALLAVPQTPKSLYDARLVAKKAATKAARPVRKPREKK